jgi:8-oxo-dGTP pyrophosphatase MutT (NUDIX family)
MPEFQEAAVSYLLRGNGDRREVLLGILSKKLWKGKWNGPGGKLDPEKDGGDTRRCATREAREEWGVELLEPSLRQIATVDYYQLRSFGDEQKYVPWWRVHFFQVYLWTGTPTPVSEFVPGTLRWYPVNKLPLEDERTISDRRGWLLHAFNLQDVNSMLQVRVHHGTDGLSTDDVIFDIVNLPEFARGG